MKRDLTPEEFQTIKRQVIEKLAADRPDLADKSREEFEAAYRPVLMEAARMATLVPEPAAGGVVSRILQAGVFRPIAGLVELGKGVAESTRQQVQAAAEQPGKMLTALREGRPLEAAMQLPGMQTLASVAQAIPQAARGDVAGGFSSALAPVRNVPVIGPVVEGLGYGQVEQARQAAEEFQAGNYNRAAGYAAGAAIPLIGPALTAAGERIRGGDIAGGLTEAAAAVGSPKLPEGLSIPGVVRNRNLDLRGVINRTINRGLPVDLATASGVPLIETMQRVGGEGVIGMIPTMIRSSSQARKYETEAARLAAASTGQAGRVSPAQAGEAALTGVTEARNRQLAAGRAAYSDADMYAAMADPEWVPTPETMTPARMARTEHSLGRPVSVGELQELRRITAEMEAMPFTPRTWRSEGVSRAESNVPSGQHVLIPGGAGASVFDDIVEKMPQRELRDPKTGQVTLHTPDPTRDEVVASLKRAIATGHFTGPAKGAMDVVAARMQPGSAAARRAQLPPSAGELPPTNMQLPVDVRNEKDLLRPAYEREKKFLEATKERADPGFSALARFMEGPDDVPLQDLDKLLGRFKGLSRGGKQVRGVEELSTPSQVFARQALSVLEPKLKEKAATVPGLLEALETGREAWSEMYKIEQPRKAMARTQSDVLRFGKMTGPHGAEMLADVQKHAPEVIPQIAKAKLDQINELAFNSGPTGPQKALKVFNQMEQRTLDILIPDKAHQADLKDLYTIMLARAKNVNPSGSALVGIKTGEIGSLLASAYWGTQGGKAGALIAPTVALLNGAFGLAAHSPTITKLLVQGTKIPLRNPTMMAAWSQQLTQAVKAAQEEQAAAEPQEAEATR